MTFNHTMELAVLRTRLEADGIECFVLDELTTQVNPFYSNAIGGVKLQVKESDVQKSIEILKDSGYIKEEHILKSKTLDKLILATLRIPLLNKLRLELRLMIIVAVSVLIIIGTLYFVTLPSTFEQLTKQSWCVDRVNYNGKDFAPITIKHIQFTGAGFCEESIDIEKNGAITLPGFSSYSARGYWTLRNNSLEIMQVDTFAFVYDGIYSIELSNNRLILKSNQTTLSCHPENIEINLPFYR